jgi:hypothetical protein
MCVCEGAGCEGLWSGGGTCVLWGVRVGVLEGRRLSSGVRGCEPWGCVCVAAGCEGVSLGVACVWLRGVRACVLEGGVCPLGHVGVSLGVACVCVAAGCVGVCSGGEASVLWGVDPYLCPPPLRFATPPPLTAGKVVAATAKETVTAVSEPQPVTRAPAAPPP